jgi:hypothetical protein
MKQIAVFTFPSVYHALRAEKILQQGKLTGKLIAIPRVLSSCCQGLGLVVAVEDQQKTELLLRENKLNIEKSIVLSETEVFS